MRRVIASLGDDAPSASAKRAECAKGDRLVVHVDVLGLEDTTIVLGLPCAVLVGSETTFRSRLVVNTSVDQRVCGQIY